MTLPGFEEPDTPNRLTLDAEVSGQAVYRMTITDPTVTRDELERLLTKGGAYLDAVTNVVHRLSDRKAIAVARLTWGDLHVDFYDDDLED